MAVARVSAVVPQKIVFTHITGSGGIIRRKLLRGTAFEMSGHLFSAVFVPGNDHVNVLGQDRASEDDVARFRHRTLKTDADGTGLPAGEGYGRIPQ